MLDAGGGDFFLQFLTEGLDIGLDERFGFGFIFAARLVDLNRLELVDAKRDELGVSELSYSFDGFFVLSCQAIFE